MFTDYMDKIINGELRSEKIVKGFDDLEKIWKL